MDGDIKRKILLYFCILAFGVVGVYIITSFFIKCAGRGHGTRHCRAKNYPSCIDDTTSFYDSASCRGHQTKRRESS